MNKFFTAAIIAAMATAGSVESAAAGTNLVQDPNFETTTSGFYYGVGNNLDWQNLGPYGGGTLRGVATSTSLFGYGSPTLSTQPPGNFLYMDGGPGYQTYAFGQTITGLTPGATYNLSFDAAYATENLTTGDTIQWIANLGGTPTFGSDSQYTGFSGGQTNAGPLVTIPARGTGWTPTTLASFTATASSESLSFVAVGSGDPPFALITGISLTSAAPEPGTWAMMILGFGALGGLARRRRAIAAAGVPVAA